MGPDINLFLCPSIHLCIHSPSLRPSVFTRCFSCTQCGGRGNDGPLCNSHCCSVSAADQLKCPAQTVGKMDHYTTSSPMKKRKSTSLPVMDVLLLQLRKRKKKQHKKWTIRHSCLSPAVIKAKEGKLACLCPQVAACAKSCVTQLKPRPSPGWRVS